MKEVIGDPKSSEDTYGHLYEQKERVPPPPPRLARPNKVPASATTGQNRPQSVKRATQIVGQRSIVQFFKKAGKSEVQSNRVPNTVTDDKERPGELVSIGRKLRSFPARETSGKMSTKKKK